MDKQSRAIAVCLVSGVLCLTVGCAGATGAPRTDGTYSSQHGNFVVPVPSMGLLGAPPSIQEGSDEVGGRVAFHDDLGVLLSITYLQLPPGSDEVLTDADRREAAVRGFLHSYALPELFRQAATGAEVLMEEPVGAGVAFEYFAVVRIPEGSVLEDMVTGKRLDSTRALMIFPHAGYMYMLGYARGLMNDDSVDAFAASARERLTEFRSTIQFK